MVRVVIPRQPWTLTTFAYEFKWDILWCAKIHPSIPFQLLARIILTFPNPLISHIIADGIPRGQGNPAVQDWKLGMASWKFSWRIELTCAREEMGPAGTKWGGLALCSPWKQSHSFQLVLLRLVVVVQHHPRPRPSSNPPAPWLFSTLPTRLAEAQFLYSASGHDETSTNTCCHPQIGESVFLACGIWPLPNFLPAASPPPCVVVSDWLLLPTMPVCGCSTSFLSCLPAFLPCNLCLALQRASSVCCGQTVALMALPRIPPVQWECVWTWKWSPHR